MKTMVTRFLSVIFLTAMCSCGESKKETQEKARHELWSAAWHRQVDKHSASEQDAKPYQIVEYAESLAEFNRVLRKCKDLGLEESVIESAEKDGAEAGYTFTERHRR